MACLTSENIKNNGGVVNENSDGSVSVFVNDNGILIPFQLNKICCETLKTGYFFDIDKQSCKWGTGTTVTFLTEPVKMTINPDDNDGALFLIHDNETCSLNVSFDYLFNIKCENLKDVLNSTTVNSEQVELIANIKLYTGLIENQKTDCEIITNHINELNTQISATSYSIFCDKVPVPQITQNVVPLNTSNSFSNSAFGNNTIIQPTNVPTPTLYETVNYCLTEPTGLEEWSKILGSRYQAFLVGTASSYTCEDVLKIKALNDVNGGLLINCTIPFGTKSKLINDRTILLTDSAKCQSDLLLLETTLSGFNTTLATVGDTITTAPIDFFETLDVSVSLEIIDETNANKTVFLDNFFPAIGHGNLYNYLVAHNNSGFYVCGNENIDNIGLSGCTPFTLPTKLVNEPTDVNPCNPVADKEPRANASSCDLINKSISGDLFIESGLDNNSVGKETFINTLPNNALISNWLNYSTIITDSAILDLIKGKKVKLTVNINKIGSDFCVLLDNITLDKDCDIVLENSIFVTESPSFHLSKIVDNKKSWTDSTMYRDFLIESNTGTNTIRETSYDVSDRRLVINTKEIDLDVNLAAAIENDVWHYILTNPCVVSGNCSSTTVTGTTTGVTYHKQFEDEDPFEFEDDENYCFEDDIDCTGSTHIIITSETINTCCDPCGCFHKQFQDEACFDFQDDSSYHFMDDNLQDGKSGCCGDNIDFIALTTTPFSAITTLQDFQHFLSTELIDAKSRKTIIGYGTLKALYERYQNSSLYCSTLSSGFGYLSIEGFAKLVGDYWTDIVEQVVPATTIWGSAKIYSNTVFDQQKFKYKSYTSLFGGNPYSGISVSSPIMGEGICTSDADVISVSLDISGSSVGIGVGDGKYNKVCARQMNFGSEFIGSVRITYNTPLERDNNAAFAVFHMGQYSS